MSDQNDNNVNMLDPSKFFSISGNVANIREREYNGTVTKYIMIEDDSNPDWPNFFEVEFYKDKADLVSGVKNGDFITCQINFGGRKWEKDGEIKGAFFSLKGWKAEVRQSQASAPIGAPPQAQAPQQFQQPQPAFQQGAPIPQEFQQPSQANQPYQAPHQAQAQAPQSNMSQANQPQFQQQAPPQQQPQVGF